MRKIFFLCSSLLTTVVLSAQQKEGKVVYQRTIQMQIRFTEAGGSENEMPRTRTDKFEMNFANGKMIIKQMEDEIQDDNFSGGGGVMIRTMGEADDATYCDF